MLLDAKITAVPSSVSHENTRIEGCAHSHAHPHRRLVASLSFSLFGPANVAMLSVVLLCSNRTRVQDRQPRRTGGGTQQTAGIESKRPDHRCVVRVPSLSFPFPAPPVTAAAAASADHARPLLFVGSLRRKETGNAQPCVRFVFPCLSLSVSLKTFPAAPTAPVFFLLFARLPSLRELAIISTPPIKTSLPDPCPLPGTPYTARLHSRTPSLFAARNPKSSLFFFHMNDTTWFYPLPPSPPNIPLTYHSPRLDRSPSTSLPRPRTMHRS